MSIDFLWTSYKKLSSIYFESYLRTDESGGHKTLDIFRTNKNKHSKTSRINLTCSRVIGWLFEIHSVEISCSRAAIDFTIMNKSSFFRTAFLHSRNFQKFKKYFSLFFASYNASEIMRLRMNDHKCVKCVNHSKHV